MRKTRQQKIIADLRRQLHSQAPSTPAPAVVRPSPTFSLPATLTPSPSVKLLDHSRLGSDLTKVGTLVGLSVLIELVISVAISHGYLVKWGIF